MTVPPRPSAAALGGKDAQSYGERGGRRQGSPRGLETADTPLPRPSLTGRYIPRAAAAAPEATLKERERTALVPVLGPRPRQGPAPKKNALWLVRITVHLSFLPPQRPLPAAIGRAAPLGCRRKPLWPGGAALWQRAPLPPAGSPRYRGGTEPPAPLGTPR